MELLQLEYFCRLAVDGNLTRTAAALYISPSSLSLTIRRLERDLGVALFDRTGGRLRLNERGEAFLRQLEPGLRQLEAGTRLVRALGMRSDTTVTVATANQNVWNELLCDFLLANPDISLRHQSFVWFHSLEADLLANNELILSNVGLCSDTNLIERPLFEGKGHAVAVCAGHPLTKAALPLPPLLLADEPIILPPRGFPLNTRYRTLCRQAGFEPKVVAECDYFLRARMVAEGLGVTFTAREGGVGDLLPDCRVLPLDGIPYSGTRALIWDRRRELSPAAARMREYILAYYAAPLF